MSSRQETRLVVLSYVALLIASLYPQSVSPQSAIAYVGDSLESVYIVAWNVHQLFRDPAHLFDANILYPVDDSLALTDHRLLPSVLVAPVVWATGNPVLAYNVALALALLLAAFGGRHLAKVLGIGAVGAWATGALYAFHTYQINEAPRLNIVAHGFIPFALAELLRYLKSGERVHAWRLAGLGLLQATSSNYHLLYAAFVLGLVTVAWTAARPRETLRRLPPLLLAGGLAALAYAPIAWPYFRVARTHALSRDLPAGIDLRHYVSTAPSNIVYGPIGGPVRLQQRAAHFVGFVSMALAALAVVAWSRKPGATEEGLVPPRVWIPAAALLALLFVALSLGRDVAVFGRELGPGPYRLLYYGLPGFQLVRIPERLALLAMLFVALLVGRALTVLPPRVPRAVVILLAALVPLEHLSPLATERVPVGGDVPAVYRWLATQPVRAVAEVPVHGEGLVRKETIEAYFSTYHWKPVIHGYTAYPLLVTKVMRRMAAEFPSEVALQALGRVGVDTVVVHADRADSRLNEAVVAAVAARRLEHVASFPDPETHVYRVHAGPPSAPAPFPAGRRARENGWRYRTKAGDPAPAADGDPRTVWRVPRALNGDEFYEIRFDRPLAVSGVVLRLNRDSAFPTRLRVGGLDLQGRWTELARLDDAHWLQLLESVLSRPGPGAFGFDLGGRVLTGVILQPGEGGSSFEGWSIPEIEVLTP
jgi:hypothetical protein